MSSKLRIGIFTEENQLLEATRKAREAGCEIQDAYTPYAVHGLDQAMGLKPNNLTRLCLILGLIGVASALFFQIWVFEVDWPINVGGKSYTALPALIPVTFEFMVLLAALGTVLGMLIKCKLWPNKKEVLPAEGITDDRFVLALRIPEGGGAQDGELLKRYGAVEVKEVEVDL